MRKAYENILGLLGRVSAKDIEKKKRINNDSLDTLCTLHEES